MNIHMISIAFAWLALGCASLDHVKRHIVRSKPLLHESGIINANEGPECVKDFETLRWVNLVNILRLKRLLGSTTRGVSSGVCKWLSC